jgi:hypothetical protein
MKPITLRVKTDGIQAILNATPHSYPEIALWRELSAQLGEHIAQLEKLERDPKRNEPADEALKADLRRRIADRRRRIADLRRRIDALCDKEVDDSEDQRCKAAMLRAIRTRRQQLEREVRGRRCSAERREEIKRELQNFKGIEHQECGTGKPKHPSLRPSGRELGFETDTPSVDEILEMATIQRGLRLEKPHLMFAKLAKKSPVIWGEVTKRDPKIGPAKKRIEFGDIKEVGESKRLELSKLDRLIAENYFESQKLEKPLRESSADKAAVELKCELRVTISPDAFDRALRRLCLVD